MFPASATWSNSNVVSRMQRPNKDPRPLSPCSSHIAVEIMRAATLFLFFLFVMCKTLLDLNIIAVIHFTVAQEILTQVKQRKELKRVAVKRRWSFFFFRRISLLQ